MTPQEAWKQYGETLRGRATEETGALLHELSQDLNQCVRLLHLSVKATDAAAGKPVLPLTPDEAALISKALSVVGGLLFEYLKQEREG